MGEPEKTVKRAIAIGDEPVVLAQSLSKPSTPNALPTPTTWNTDKLGLRLGSDALAAGAAGALVAPIITIIDKGIIENASGRNTLSESLKKSARKLLLKPHRFLTGKPFALIFVRLPSPISTPPQLIHPSSNRPCTSVPTSPRTQSTPSPQPARTHPTHPPQQAPPNSPQPPPPTSPSASTKTTNSPSSSPPHRQAPNARSHYPHSPSSPSATALPSSPHSTCHPCSRRR